MSGLRAFRRVGQHPDRTEPHRPAKGLSRRDLLLFVGLPLLGCGVEEGGRNARIYAFGQRKQVVNSTYGIYFLPEEGSGDPRHRTAAITGFTVGGVGLALTVCWVIATFGGRLWGTAVTRDEKSGG